uniref:Transposase n=1 Tax=Globodera pallida TaxID=36090 RepID=A0A183BJA7_GLOPA
MPRIHAHGTGILNDSSKIAEAKGRRVKWRCRKQSETRHSRICSRDARRNLPVLKHIDGLQFYDEPDYTLIISILRNHLILSAINEHPFDWEIPPAELRSQRGVPLTKIKTSTSSSSAICRR